MCLKRIMNQVLRKKVEVVPGNLSFSGDIIYICSKCRNIVMYKENYCEKCRLPLEWYNLPAELTEKEKIRVKDIYNENFKDPEEIRVNIEELLNKIFERGIKDDISK